MEEELRGLLPNMRTWPSMPSDPSPKLVYFYHFTKENSLMMPYQLSIADCEHIVKKYTAPISISEPFFHHETIEELMTMRSPDYWALNERHIVFRVMRMRAFRTQQGREMLRIMFEKMTEPPKWSVLYYVYKDIEALADLAKNSFAITWSVGVTASHEDIVERHLATFLAGAHNK
jgi:hypothetical protein